MKMRLERLEIENFKGCRKASFSFGEETIISGRNASGKTTIADAFFWLLFNQDFHGNAPGSDKFREKPMDADGMEIHHLDTSVTAYCTLDGNPFKLKRLQRENWVKRRGAKDAAYGGNTSTYWINDVETKASDYTARINGIANGELLSVVLKLGAFNMLDKSSKRSMLLHMSGSDVDSVLIGKQEYKPLADEIVSRGITVDEMKKVLSDQRKRINQELTLLPAKMDEVSRMTPTYTEQEIKDAEFNVTDIEHDIASCREMIASIESGNGTGADIEAELLRCESDLIKAKRAIMDEYDKGKRSLTESASQAESALKSAKQVQSAATMTVATAKVRVGEAERMLNDARNEYRRIYAMVFVHPERQSVCPVCGQEITDSCWEKSLKAQEEAFKGEKKANLEVVSVRGRECEGRYEDALKASEEAEKALEIANAEVQKASVLFAQTSDMLSAYPPAPDFNVSSVMEIEEQIDDLRMRRKAPPDERIANLRERIAELTGRYDRAKQTLAKKDRKVECEHRLDELKSEQANLGQNKADIENLIYMSERFISERCSLLEERINDLFPTIRWKLFDKQINGSFVDCCECMINGSESLVPYSSANTAARINADIEIIGALSRFYDLVVPVFVDNAESVNYIAKPEGQLIALNVSLDDELKVKIKEVA